MKSKHESQINKYSAKFQLLEPINIDPKSIKYTKNDIVSNLSVTHLHEIFKQYVNAELKIITLQQTLQHPSIQNIQKASIQYCFLLVTSVSVSLTLFLSLSLSLSVSLSLTNKNVMGEEAMFKKKFEDLKGFTHFADNNVLETSEKFTKVRSLYDVMNKNLKQFFFFFMLFTSFMNE